MAHSYTRGTENTTILIQTKTPVPSWGRFCCRRVGFRHCLPRTPTARTKSFVYPMSDQLFTLQEAVDFCKCCPRTLQRLIAQRKFGVVKLGRLTRIFRSELEAFLKRQQTRTA